MNCEYKDIHILCWAGPWDGQEECPGGSVGLILAAWETTSLLGAQLPGEPERPPSWGSGWASWADAQPRGQKEAPFLPALQLLAGSSTTSGAQDQQRDTWHRLASNLPVPKQTNIDQHCHAAVAPKAMPGRVSLSHMVLLLPTAALTPNWCPAAGHMALPGLGRHNVPPKSTPSRV